MRRLAVLVVALLVGSGVALATVAERNDDAPQQLSAGGSPAATAADEVEELPSAMPTSSTTATTTRRTATTRPKALPVTLPTLPPITLPDLPDPLDLLVDPDASTAEPCNRVGVAGIPQGQVGVPPFVDPAGRLAVVLNCKPVLGDAIELMMQGPDVDTFIVDWGDGSPRLEVDGYGCQTSSISSVQSHTYLLPRTYVVTIAAKAACRTTEVLRLRVDVTAGLRPLPAVGAAPCWGLGPALPNTDEPRSGMSRQYFGNGPSAVHQLRVALMRCRVPVGTVVYAQPSWAESFTVDWGDGSPVSSVAEHTPTATGTYRVKVSGAWGVSGATPYTAYLTLIVVPADG